MNFPTRYPCVDGHMRGLSNNPARVNLHKAFRIETWRYQTALHYIWGTNRVACPHSFCPKQTLTASGPQRHAWSLKGASDSLTYTCSANSNINDGLSTFATSLLEHTYKQYINSACSATKELGYSQNLVGNVLGYSSEFARIPLRWLVRSYN